MDEWSSCLIDMMMVSLRPSCEAGIDIRRSKGVLCGKIPWYAIRFWAKPGGAAPLMGGGITARRTSMTRMPSFNWVLSGAV